MKKNNIKKRAIVIKIVMVKANKTEVLLIKKNILEAWLKDKTINE